jgi:hypothetical protein
VAVVVSPQLAVAEEEGEERGEMASQHLSPYLQMPPRGVRVRWEARARVGEGARAREAAAEAVRRVEAGGAEAMRAVEEGEQDGRPGGGAGRRVGVAEATAAAMTGRGAGEVVRSGAGRLAVAVEEGEGRGEMASQHPSPYLQMPPRGVRVRREARAWEGR